MNGIGLNGSLLLGAQSLNAQQLAISTIGNNISNINTPGYARERANLVNTETNTGTGEIGSGVTVANIESVRSSILDNLVQQSLGNQGYANDQATLTSTVQSSLGEDFGATASSGSSSTSTTSGPIQGALTSFFAALQNLASTPTDTTARQQVVQDATSLSDSLNTAYQRVQATQSQIATDAGSIATQINQLSKTIASLNQQIVQVQSSTGSNANDLIDARTADVETLSGLVNVNVTPQTNGSVTIALADNPAVTLVSGSNGGGAGSTQSLSVSYNANASVPLTVSASTTGSLGAGVPSSGSLGSHLEAVNNLIGAPAASGGTGLLASLDNVASQIISQLNTQNEAGYDLSGNAGTALFTGSGAGNIAVSSTIANNPSLIAAGNGSGTLDGSNALAMANLQNSASIIPAFQATVTGLGTAVSTAASNQSVQNQVTTSLQNQQSSVSGVSIDEEMTNLISFQQAYSASARFITTISSMYNTLVAETQ
jgi:flagellar hook-associated protein 1 FlgK